MTWNILTIDIISIVIVTTFRPICPLAFFRCSMSNSVVQINVSVQGSVWTPEFDVKYLKKADGHIGRNVVIITIKMRSIVRIF